MGLRRTVLLVIAGVLLVAVAYRATLLKPLQAQRHGGRISFDRNNFDPQRVLGALPPIIRPPFVDAEEASQQIHDNELVLGLEIDGVSRAYPINMLTGPRREIFNDKLGEHFVAATW